MTASVRVLTTASVDSTPSLLLVSPDGSKILVDCGEGCQRSFLEHSQRLSTVKTVCLTDLKHTTVGGLPGLVLTASNTASAAAMEAAQKAAANSSNNNQNSAAPSTKDTPLPGLDIVGPEGTQAFLHSLRHFMRREKFQLQVHEGPNTRLEAVQKPSKRSSKKSTVQDESPAFCIHSFRFGSASRKRSRDEQTPHGPLSFLFTMPPIPGKFLPDQAKELGVPKGPLFGKLKAGQSVTFTNENGDEVTVESHQVVTPPSPGVGVLVLRWSVDSRDGPASSDLDVMSGCIQETLESCQAELDVVVHLIEDVNHYPRLDIWKSLFGDNVEHVYIPLQRQFQFDLDGTPFRSAATGAYARSLLCPEIYRVPLPPHDEADPSVLVEPGATRGRSMMEYMLLPRSKKGLSSLSISEYATDKNDAAEEAEASGALPLARQLLPTNSTPETDQNTPCGGELWFTGTGSSLPCKHRNVTGMCLTMKNHHSILLDVGEGTIGQLLRAANIDSDEGVRDFLSKIRAVWISHPHADHHLGILRLLAERQSDERLLLLAPAHLFRFLQEYEQVDTSVRGKYVAIDCKDLVHENREAVSMLATALGITGIRSVPVAHCPQSYAVVLEGTSFGRLVYSGDCRPSHQLARVGRGADLLIHEATFEDGMEAEAALKRHSTVGEALTIAHEMQAKCTVLTHFSQRYPKIPKPPAQTNGSMRIVFAFDFMRLTPSTLGVAEKLTPALRLLYPEKEDEAETEDAGDSAVSITAMSVPGLFAQNGVV